MHGGADFSDGQPSALVARSITRPLRDPFWTDSWVELGGGDISIQSKVALVTGQGDGLSDHVYVCAKMVAQEDGALP